MPVKIVYDVDNKYLPSKVFTCVRYDGKTGDPIGPKDENREGKSLNKSVMPSSSSNESHHRETTEQTPAIQEIKPWKEFNEEALERHNYLRSLHGCPPLVLNENLGRDSQKYAEELAKKGKMVHSDGDYGENLAYKEHSRQAFHSGKFASNHWYSEIKDYNFDGDEQLNCGHFSQLVWKDTKEVGFGVALSPDKKKAMVVARYNPPGNYRGQWKQNIPKPTKSIYIPTDADIGRV